MYSVYVLTLEELQIDPYLNMYLVINKNMSVFIHQNISRHNLCNSWN